MIGCGGTICVARAQIMTDMQGSKARQPNPASLVQYICFRHFSQNKKIAYIVWRSLVKVRLPFFSKLEKVLVHL